MAREHSTEEEPNREATGAGRENPDSFDVAGMSIHPTVKVNTVNAARQDDYYRRELAHTGRPGFLGVTVQSYDAQGQPAGSPETGEVYVPRASETLNYDADGNLLGDGRWIYGWNAEERLISMETQPQAVSGIPSAQSVKLLFDYDWLGRRIRKRVYQPASSGTPVRTERYVWDGWLSVAKLEGAQTEAYVWGVDLAGSLGATGGVGGLAAILDLNSESGTVNGVHFPAYDGNGNVMALVSDVSGGPVLTARYEYDPFGNELRRSGTHAENNPWRFSTKWTDRESGLSYYGYRFYDPVRGRWLNRDPIGEEGGLNLYGFVTNDPFNQWDYLGMKKCGLKVKVDRKFDTRLGVLGYLTVDLAGKWLAAGVTREPPSGKRKGKSAMRTFPIRKGTFDTFPRKSDVTGAVDLNLVVFELKGTPPFGNIQLHSIPFPEDPNSVGLRQGWPLDYTGHGCIWLGTSWTQTPRITRFRDDDGKMKNTYGLDLHGAKDMLGTVIKLYEKHCCPSKPLSEASYGENSSVYPLITTEITESYEQSNGQDSWDHVWEDQQSAPVFPNQVPLARPVQVPLGVEMPRF